MTDTTTQHHYWQGTFIGDEEAARRLATLPAAVEAALAAPLDTETVLAACDALSRALADPAHPVRDRLAPHLPAGGEADTEELLGELAAFLGRGALTRKLRRELGGTAPQRLNRPDAKETVYEAWAPVGLVAHIAPGNAATVAPLSLVEGLLAGNVNVLKTSGADTLLAQHLLAELAALDPTGALAERVIVLRFPSSREDWLRLMCAPADAVAVWGGEAAVEGVAAHVPAGCRLVEWGAQDLLRLPHGRRLGGREGSDRPGRGHLPLRAAGLLQPPGRLPRHRGHRRTPRVRRPPRRGPRRASGARRRGARPGRVRRAHHHRAPRPAGGTPRLHPRPRRPPTAPGASSPTPARR
ncbi:hypothetical protein GCM10020254_77850 [Streptomyces goshikiensis]